MKLSCLQESLEKGLNAVGRAVATKSTLPVTQNVLLVAENGRLRLTATNLEIAISTWIGAAVAEDGAVSVGAELFTDYVKTLPNDTVTLDIAQKITSLNLKCVRNEARFSGMDARDFPPIPRVDGSTAVISMEQMTKAVSQLIYVASTEQSRPVLTGVFADFRKTKLRMVAADGYRLAVYEVTLDEPAGEDAGIIIPAKTLAEVQRLVMHTDEPIRMAFSPAKSQAVFKMKDIEVVSQLIMGNYPNYSHLIPEKYASRTVVKIEDFVRAIKANVVMARDGNLLVKIQCSPPPEGKMTIFTDQAEIGEAKVDIDAKTEGAGEQIAFNCEFLLDMAERLLGEELAMETNGGSSPAVFRSLGMDEYLQVIMPTFVKW